MINYIYILQLIKTFVTLQQRNFLSMDDIDLVLTTIWPGYLAALFNEMIFDYKEIVVSQRLDYICFFYFETQHIKSYL